MRRFLMTTLAALAFAALFAAMPAAEEHTETTAAARVVPIQVRIKCNGENVGEFTINNQAARLSKSAGDTANFQLLGDSDVTSVTLGPKPGVEWPFVDVPPTFGRGNDKGSGAIRADIPVGSYGYNLYVTCGGVRDEIDPKMDIDP